jgi:hypothetical protein
VKSVVRDRAWTWIGAAALVAVVVITATAALLAGEPGPGRVAAIRLAAGVCLFGSLSGWIAGRCARQDPALAVAASLAAICLRIFPPLAALAWIRSAGETWRESGAAEWLLIFYLALLATDILLHIIGSRAGGRGGARAEN